MLSKYNYAVESIAHQKETVLRDALIVQATAIREQSAITVKDLKRFADVIRIRTGLNFIFTIVPGHTAAMRMPDIDKNNPIITEYRRWYGTRKDTISLLNSKPKIKGTVDLVASKVTGDWARLEIELMLGNEFLAKGFLTDRELVAVILHEVGHAFTYLEMLGTTLTANFALTAAVADADFGKNTKRTVEIIYAADGLLNIKTANADMVARGGRDVFVSSVLADVITQQKSELGTSVFDERGSEVLADQFAARHGLGMDLVTGLDKINRLYGSMAYSNTSTWVMVEVVKVLAFLTMPLAGPLGAMFMAGVLLTNPTRNEYDPPYQRGKRIRDQVVSALKEPKITKDRRRDLLEQIDSIDDVLVEINDRSTFYEFLWSKVLPWGTKTNDKENLQRTLETLMNNDMFVSSQRLRNLA